MSRRTRRQLSAPMSWCRLVSQSVRPASWRPSCCTPGRVRRPTVRRVRRHHTRAEGSRLDREARHLRGPRVLCAGSGKPLTQKVLQVLVRRTARRANVMPGIHILRHHVLFAPGDAWSAGKGHSGTGWTPGPGHDATSHAPQPGSARRRDSVVGDGHRNEPRGRSSASSTIRSIRTRAGVETRIEHAGRRSESGAATTTYRGAGPIPTPRAR